MEQRKQIVRSFVSRGLRVAKAVFIAEIPKSSYYYRSNGRLKGKKPSAFTSKNQGEVVSNDVVMAEILDIITPEYHDYGYQGVTQQLRRRGYKINPKKVYRLMKINQMLHPKVKKGERISKEYVKHTTPLLESPFATIEADIKYIYIHEQKRNAYLITFLCTFSRFAAVWELDYSMRSGKIANLVRNFLSHPVVIQHTAETQSKVKIRTDNGPQFIAKNLSEELDRVGVIHEFIKPGTPQENGHIEAFHWTVTRLVCNRNLFSTLDHARETLNDFFAAYNYTRAMKSLLYYSPYEFLNLWNAGEIEIKKDNYGREKFFFSQKLSPKDGSSSCTEDLIGHVKNNHCKYSFSNPVGNSPV
jgi:transposase InsO family protein